MHSKGNHTKMKRQPIEWEKNICKLSNRLVINLQNIQTAHAAQYEKDKQPNQKIGGRSK